MDSNQAKYYFGTIKCYYPLKGFGFIKRDQGKDVLFHRYDFPSEESIMEGTLVKFTVKKNPKGPQAKNLEKIGASKK